LLTDLLIVALATGLLVSFADRWLPDGMWRGALALVVSVGWTLVVLDYSGWMAAMIACAAAFTSLIMILIGERLATPPPMVLDNRRR
jgi:hypothetical protein